MATFSRRGDYQWQVKVRRKGYPPQSQTFNVKSDAEAWARQIEGEMDRGVFVSRAEAEQTTLSEAIDRYISEIIPKKKHPDKEKRRVAALKTRSISSMFLAGIRGKEIAAFRDERVREGVSANTIRLDLAVLSHLFNIARREWGMESLINPVELVSKPKLPQGRDRRLNDDEEDKLLSAAEQYSPEMDAIVVLAIETAMRQGEILSLEWENIDLKSRIAYLPETKNGTSRSVPLSQNALLSLLSLPRRLDGMVFSYTGDGFRSSWNTLLKRAGIEGLRFHDLRHEATSRFFERGFDIMKVAAITGHKTLQMLKRYTHLRAEDLVKDLDATEQR